MIWMWVGIALGSLASLILLLAGIGLVLPKGHVAARSVRLKQPAEAVWAVITDFAAQPAWRPDLRSVEPVPGKGAAWKEIPKSGTPLTLETVESDPPRRLVRRIDDTGLPFGGTWTFDLTPAADGCVLTITERGEVYNPIFRTISKMFNMGATIETYLKNLGTRLGQAVRVEAPAAS